MFVHSKDSKHIVVLNRGEKIIESLTASVTALNLRGALISGLGALKNVELGYYELEKKEYIRKTFSEEDYELISLTGNLTLREDKPYIHVHASLGDSHFKVFGGHLFEAIVAVTAEVTFIEMDFMPIREFDKEIGLAIICGIK